jgi:hypothetical protein
MVETPAKPIGAMLMGFAGAQPVLQRDVEACPAKSPPPHKCNFILQVLARMAKKEKIA